MSLYEDTLALLQRMVRNACGIKINKIGELFGTFNVVMFSPEDLKIIKDSPGVRRRFIDM